MKFIATFLLFFSTIVPIQAITTNIACIYGSLTNACQNAVDGETIIIGAGSMIISNEIDIGNNISFEISGSGTNQTTLQSIGNLNVLFRISSDSTKVFSIHDMNLIGTSGDNYCIQFGGVNGACPGPYHFYNLKMTNVVGRGISVGYGNAFGCVDHCTLISAPSGYLQLFDLNGGNYYSWTNVINPIGTTNVCCFENNYLKATSGGNGFFDSYNGAQVLFRYNFCDGDSPIGGHGYDSGDNSIRTWEIYDNTFTNITSLIMSVWRGGTGVIFSNTAYGTPGSFNLAGLGYYRANPQVNNTYFSVFHGITNDWLKTGVPGTTYTINFSGYTNFPPGQYMTATNNLNDGDNFTVGFTHYFFITNINNATFNMANNNGFGGGAVLIGTTTAQTITNLLRAINVVPGYYGTAYTNWASLPFNIGHDYIAVGCDTTNLYLTNALDSNTDPFGYPANQQEGTLISWPLTGTNFHNPQTIWTIYAWSNTYNGTLVGITDPENTPNASLNLTNLLKAGRDFSNAIPVSTIYTPLVYPHPLVINNPTVQSGTILFPARIH